MQQDRDTLSPDFSSENLPNSFLSQPRLAQVASPQEFGQINTGTFGGAGGLSPFNRGSTQQEGSSSPWKAPEQQASPLHEAPKFIKNYFRPNEPKFNNARDQPKQLLTSEDPLSQDTDGGQFFNSSKKVRDEIKIEVLSGDPAKAMKKPKEEEPLPAYSMRRQQDLKMFMSSMPTSTRQSEVFGPSIDPQSVQIDAHHDVYDTEIENISQDLLRDDLEDYGGDRKKELQKKYSVKNKHRVNCFVKRDKSQKLPKRSSSATKLAPEEPKRFEIKLLSPEAKKGKAPQTVRKPAPPRKAGINNLVRSTAKKSGPTSGSGLQMSKSAMLLKKGIEKQQQPASLAKLKSPKAAAPTKSMKRKSIPPQASKPSEAVTLMIDSEEEAAEPEESNLLKRTEARLKTLQSLINKQTEEKKELYKQLKQKNPKSVSKKPKPLSNSIATEAQTLFKNYEALAKIEDKFASFIQKEKMKLTEPLSLRSSIAGKSASQSLLDGLKVVKERQKLLQNSEADRGSNLTKQIDDSGIRPGLDSGGVNSKLNQYIQITLDQQSEATPKALNRPRSVDLGPTFSFSAQQPEAEKREIHQIVPVLPLVVPVPRDSERELNDILFSETYLRGDARASIEVPAPEAQAKKKRQTRAERAARTAAKKVKSESSEASEQQDRGFFERSISDKERAKDEESFVLSLGNPPPSKSASITVDKRDVLGTKLGLFSDISVKKDSELRESQASFFKRESSAEPSEKHSFGKKSIMKYLKKFNEISIKSIDNIDEQNKDTIELVLKERELFKESQEFLVKKIIDLQDLLSKHERLNKHQKVDFGQKLAAARADVKRLTFELRAEEEKTNTIKQRYAEKQKEFKADMLNQLHNHKVEFERTFTSKHDMFLQYKNLAATQQVEIDQLRNEIKDLSSKVDEAQSKMKTTMQHNDSLRAKIKMLEFVNKKNQDQLKLYQELKHLSVSQSGIAFKSASSFIQSNKHRKKSFPGKPQEAKKKQRSVLVPELGGENINLDVGTGEEGAFAQRLKSMDIVASRQNATADNALSNKSLKSLREVLAQDDESRHTGRFEPLQSCQSEERIGTLAARSNGSYQSQFSHRKKSERTFSKHKQSSASKQPLAPPDMSNLSSINSPPRRGKGTAQDGINDSKSAELTNKNSPYQIDSARKEATTPVSPTGPFNLHKATMSSPQLTVGRKQSNNDDIASVRLFDFVPESIRSPTEEDAGVSATPSAQSKKPQIKMVKADLIRKNIEKAQQQRKRSLQTQSKPIPKKDKRTRHARKSFDPAPAKIEVEPSPKKEELHISSLPKSDMAGSPTKEESREVPKDVSKDVSHNVSKAVSQELFKDPQTSKGLQLEVAKVVQEIKNLLKVHFLSIEIAKQREMVRRETNLDLDDSSADNDYKDDLQGNFDYFRTISKQEKDRLLFQTQLKLIAKFKLALSKVNEQMAADPDQSLASGTSSKKAALSLEKQMMVSRQLLVELQEEFYPQIE